MRTIALMNQKGGSGKTTTAVNLAAALGAAGGRVLVIDLDPQASASDWLGVKDESRALLDVFAEGQPLAPLVRETSAAGVELVPASAWLVGAEKALAGEVGAEQVFRRALDRLPSRWDYVLVDCPPSLGLLVISSLTACGEVLVPVEATTMPLKGLAALMGTIDRVRDRLNPALHVTGILACRVDVRRRLSHEVVEKLRATFDGTVFRTVIRENVRLAEAPSFAQPITVYDARCSGAEDYTAAAEELAGRPSGGKQRTQRTQRKR